MLDWIDVVGLETGESCVVFLNTTDRFIDVFFFFIFIHSNGHIYRHGIAGDTIINSVHESLTKTVLEPIETTPHY